MNNSEQYRQWREKAADLWADIGVQGRCATLIALACAIGFLLGRCTAG